VKTPVDALGLEWLRPEWWPALLALPLVLLACAWARRRRRAALAAACDARFSERFAAEVDRRTPARRALSAGLAALGLAVALLGPARGASTRTIELRGLDIVVCLDTSRSMLARDLRPDRLGRARREIEGLLEVLREDRVALLAFSGDAREVAPLTRDRQALRGLLEAVDPQDNRVGGTDLGAAIQRALQLFDGRSGAHEAIVLLTDGEDLEGRGAAAAEEARARGIRIYVVGLGSAEGSKIPLPIDEGTEGFLRDRGGQEVVSALQDESLRHIASLTQGAYLSTAESPTPLEDLYRARLSRLDGRASQGGVQRVPHDRYQLPLALAVLALALELASSARLRRAQRTRETAAGPARDAARAPANGPAAGALASLALAFAPQAPVPSAASSQPAIDPALEAALAQLESRSRDVQASERERARAAGKLGLSLARAEDAAGAAAAFARARALAGPGELRRDCGYNAATALLQGAERARAQHRELAQAAGTAADPQALRSAHARAVADCAAARQAALELLRAQPDDRDARANLELAARWLRELEREAPQEEQPPQPDPEQQAGEQGKPEQQPQDQQQEQQPSDSQDPQQPQSQPAQQRPPDPSQSQQQPEQQPQEQASEQGEPSEPQPGEQEQPEPGEPQQQPGEQEPSESPQPQQQGEPQAKPPEGKNAREQELELTREELTRLLDQLEELERQGAAVREALRRVGRKPVERDW
jgi:Ca-activated chloride channel family protein